MKRLASFAILLLIIGIVASHPHRDPGPPADCNLGPGQLMKLVPKLHQTIKKQREALMTKISPLKSMIEKELRACKNFKYPGEWFKIGGGCLTIHAPSLIIKAAIKQELPEIYDLNLLANAVYQCSLDEAELTQNGLLNLTLLREYVEDSDFEGSDAETIKLWTSKCIDELPEPKSISDNTMMMMSLKKCFTKKMLDNCGKDSGFHYPIHYAGSTSQEEGKCTDVQVPEKMEDDLKICITEQSKILKKRITGVDGLMTQLMAQFMMMMSERRKSKENQEGGRKRKTKLRNKNILDDIDPIELVEKVLPIIQKEIEDQITDIGRCYAKKLGHINDNKYSREKFMKDLSELSGWNKTILTNFVSDLEECKSNYGIDNSYDVTENAKLYYLMKEVRLKCILPALADNCGMNNDLSTFFFPMVNKSVIEHIIEVVIDTFNELTPGKKRN